MANKQSADLRTLETPALWDRLDEAGRELMDIRFRLATRQSDNTTQLLTARRQIARIKTILTEREGEE
ncbi:MAG TPA: 50S ribosomal protein L29 [Chloroflexi bacterium]|jgi:large subunit ribosomal protein L29|nr:50S ribosomal protein L29 [Chloroflexota bacterium]